MGTALESAPWLANTQPGKNTFADRKGSNTIKTMTEDFVSQERWQGVCSQHSVPTTCCYRRDNN